MALPKLLLLSLALLAVTASAASGSKNSDLVYFLFKKQCFDKYMTGQFFDVDCFKSTLSAVLSAGIVAGACIVKVPQILRFVRAGSVAGISRWATYLDLLGYLLGVAYHLVVGTEFMKYGETAIISVQAVITVLLLWGYDFPGLVHMGLVTIGLALATQGAISTPLDKLQYVQHAATLTFIASRSWQILANARQSSTGELAFMTLFMNFAGSAARVFTSLQGKQQLEVVVSFIISTSLNLILVLQYFYYAGRKQSKPRSTVVPNTAPKVTSSDGGRKPHAN
jgi:hypothetical protein